MCAFIETQNFKENYSLKKYEIYHLVISTDKSFFANYFRNVEGLMKNGF